MATLLSLLIVMAALNALTTATRPSVSSYFIPLNNQLYESETLRLESENFILEDFLPGFEVSESQEDLLLLL